MDILGLLDTDDCTLSSLVLPKEEHHWQEIRKVFRMALWAAVKLPNTVTEVYSVNKRDESKVQFQIKFIHEVAARDPIMLQIFNVQIITFNLSEDLIQSYEEEFLQFIDNDKKNRREILIRSTQRNRLLRANIRKLTISFPNHCKWLAKLTLTAVLDTCSTLTYLDCNGGEKLSCQDYMDLVLSIPNIVVLKIADGKVLNDDILQAIGDTCPKIECLDLEVSQITDEGIDRFCHSRYRGANLKCLKLPFDNQVTVRGCLTVLFHLKQLQIFDQEYVIPAFKELFHEWDRSEIPTMQLCQFPEIHVDTIPHGFLTFLNNYCPNLSNVTLHSFKTFIDTDDIRNCNDNISFSLIVCIIPFSMPAFIGIESKLTSLNLNLVVVDIVCICSSCRNLRELILSEVWYTPIICERAIDFTKLVILELESMEFPIPIPPLKFLLGSCYNLEVLSIKGHNAVSDSLLYSILHGPNPFKCLTVLELYFCTRMSKMLILDFLQMSNYLNRLLLHCCDNFFNEDYLQIESFIRKHNYNVSLQVVR